MGTTMIAPGAIDALTFSATRIGLSQPWEHLLADTRGHLDYAERCATEAEAVLKGDRGAARRLSLLLAEGLPPAPAIPDDIVARALGKENGRREIQPPRILAGDTLLRLIAGVVRAAGRPEEAQHMLATLGQVLAPLFHLELLSLLVTRGDMDTAKTLLTARSVPHWRTALTPAGLEIPPTKPPHPGPPNVLNGDWKLVSVPNAFGKFADLWPCMGRAGKAMSTFDRFAPGYSLDSISNPTACKGDRITLFGSGFGTSAGRVWFSSPLADDPAFIANADPGVIEGVVPERWTDTEIDVIVPAWATTGPMQLYVYATHQDHCMTVNVYKLGYPILFQGGLATVYQAFVAGVEVHADSKKPTNLTPGDSVALRWIATDGPGVTVDIALRDDESGTILFSKRGFPGGNAGTVLDVPDPLQPRRASLLFSAHSGCGATMAMTVPVYLSVRPTLNIRFVEVTQGVQGGPGDEVSGGIMPMVADKDTAVRVHMVCDRHGWNGNYLDKITGVLKVDGKPLFPTNQRGVVPDRGFVSIFGMSNADLTNTTLNFTIPAAWLQPGPHSLSVAVVAKDPVDTVSAATNLQWTWFAKAPMQVRALWLGHYPSEAGMLSYLRDALEYLPTSLGGIGIAPPVWALQKRDLTVSDDWDKLACDLTKLWDAADETEGVVWLGIIPSSERYNYPNPPGSPVPYRPLAHSGVSNEHFDAVAAMGDVPESGAHELCHAWHRNHVHLPDTGSNQPAPDYDYSDSGGRLRRAPFRVRASEAIALPAYDLMTYMDPRGAGITTWMAMFNTDFAG